MTRGSSNKISTPTRTRVNFNPEINSGNSLTNTHSLTDNSSEDTTFSTNTLSAAEDQRLTETINKTFGKKICAKLNGIDAILKELRDSIIRNEEALPKELSPYIHSFRRDMSVKI